MSLRRILPPIVETIDTGTVGRHHQVVDLVAGSTCTEYGEVEALPLEVQSHTIGELRNTRTEVNHIILNGSICQATVLSNIHRTCIFRIYTCILITAEVPNRVARLEGRLHFLVETADTTLRITGQHRVHLLNLVLQRREVSADAVLEVTNMVAPASLDIETSVQHLTRVHGLRVETELGEGLNANEKVLSHLAIPVDGQ